MNTEKLIDFFNWKLEQLPELRKFNDYREQTFTTWWNTVKSTCERMGDSYKQKAERVRFSPGMTIGGQDIAPDMLEHIIKV